jgi:UDP-N-acetylmuramoyl-tripeptide--D-alanyl-D-alanine ligase
MATPIPTNTATFTWDELVRLSGAEVVRGPKNTVLLPISGVAIDSRAVQTGGIFLALRGETHDGHSFVPTAMERNAAVLIVERDVDAIDAAILRVPDTKRALRELASLHLWRWRAKNRPVFCVTGSSGKTTTKEMLAALIAQRMPVCKTLGNLNNLFGVPMMVLTLGDEHKAAVFEAGMSIPGEMELLSALLTPDVSTIVNVGLAHAEGVGGPEGIAKEKGAVYQHLVPGGVAVANADDARVMGQLGRARAANVVTFGKQADYQLISRSLSDTGVQCVLKARTHTLNLRLPMLSPAQVTDLLCALACAESRYDAFSESEINAAMRSLKLEGRAAIETLKDGITLIDDAYNANPESMREALRLLAELGQGRRRVAIVGDMRELGTYSVGAHQALAAELRAAGVALVIGCGTEIVETLAALRESPAERSESPIVAMLAESPEHAAKLALSHLLSMDVVLVKASRGIALDRACNLLRKSLAT